MLLMNRRDLITYAAILAPLLKSPAIWARSARPEIAFTFDDPKTEDVGRLSWQEVNERMLDALAKHRIKSVLFVAGKRVDSEAGRQLVAAREHRSEVAQQQHAEAGSTCHRVRDKGDSRDAGSL